MKVILTADEGLAAVSVGALQMMRATQRGWVGKDHGGSSGRDLRERWAQSIHGSMAEYAVCKYLDKCWQPGIEGVGECDIMPDIHVRATPWSNGHLIVNESEIEKYGLDKFVLITGHWPTFVLRGWVFGFEAQVADWFRANERPPSFWVPQSDLKNVNTLVNSVE